MRKVLGFGLAVAFAGTAAMATDISFDVQSGGSNEVTVVPGAEVSYSVMGMLSSSSDNEGLALVGFDLEFSGDDLGQADTPTENPMANFVMDEGITNPDGYGGTIIDGNLVQIGGGQNTIMNVVENAPFPIGSVITGVAHSNVVLVTGTLTAPMEDGTYTLALTNAFANVIQQGEDGDPFWATAAANVGEVVDLTIIVSDTIVIVDSNPPNGAIDGRQPASLSDDCATPAGWDAIDITFSGDAVDVVSGDFTITVDPADMTPPSISSMSTDGNTVSLMLDGIIPTGHWTIFTHISGTSTTLGNLPADVNGDATSGPVDILDLIDHINGVIVLPEWGTDADRSGVTNPADILTVIDLLNGAGCFDAWNGMSLP